MSKTRSSSKKVTISQLNNHEIHNKRQALKDIKILDTKGKNISNNMISNMRNILKSIEIAETGNSDLYYFLEDDYIHEKNAISEMLQPKLKN